jgi:heme exporter protein C
MNLKQNWWKILALLLLAYAVLWGLTIGIPRLPIIHESIRNLFYHVGMWFAMMVLFIISFVYSLRHLRGFNRRDDIIASEAAAVALMFGFLGLVTGMIWANFTWGKPWVSDPQLNGAAVSVLAYLAYFVLRGSLDEMHKRGRVAAVYNIFAFVMLIVFLGIMPRLASSSLHPSSTNDPGMTVAKLDDRLRTVFYPAAVGWILLGVWIMTIRVRVRKVKDILEENIENSEQL